MADKITLEDFIKLLISEKLISELELRCLDWDDFLRDKQSPTVAQAVSYIKMRTHLETQNSSALPADTTLIIRGENTERSNGVKTPPVVNGKAEHTHDYTPFTSGCLLDETNKLLSELLAVSKRQADIMVAMQKTLNEIFLSMEVLITQQDAILSQYQTAATTPQNQVMAHQAQPSPVNIVSPMPATPRPSSVPVAKGKKVKP